MNENLLVVTMSNKVLTTVGVLLALRLVYKVNETRQNLLQTPPMIAKRHKSYTLGETKEAYWAYKRKSETYAPDRVWYTSELFLRLGVWRMLFDDKVGCIEPKDAKVFYDALLTHPKLEEKLQAIGGKCVGLALKPKTIISEDDVIHTFACYMIGENGEEIDFSLMNGFTSQKKRTHLEDGKIKPTA